ncbi:MAG: glycine cleavage system aminomethyltransferase GcvT [Deltaproteobacteria bacterium]|nr:glycine cleavage system aminomethyltransferase GcvT [Deltaproteobacteria bacterium]
MRKTPLYDGHVKLGAQMTEFAGYSMPVRYTSDRAEHMAVREKVGLFDVSHMGEVWVTGPNSERALSELLNQDTSKYKAGRAFYALLLNEKMGIVDDLVGYKFSAEKFLLCVNAANRDKDFAWIKKHCKADVHDASDEWAQIAIQGPMAREMVASLVIPAEAGIQNMSEPTLDASLRWHDTENIKRFRFTQIGDYIVARTGYTGEDGFEIFCPPEKAPALWDTLAKEATPCGLAARDTLRLEAGMPLHGNDISEETTPWEAGLGKFVGLASQEPKRKLVGLKLEGRGIARPGYEVCMQDGQTIGKVTSGTRTPFLNQAIAMAYINKPTCDEEKPVYVKIRNNLEPASICALPFYRSHKR